jgi:hypothetical protein
LTGGDKGLTPKRGGPIVFSRGRDEAVTGAEGQGNVYDGILARIHAQLFPAGMPVTIAPPHKISVKPAERWEKPALSAA